MADKDETMPVSSDQDSNPKMSLATNNTERHYVESSNERYHELIVEKYIPKSEPKTGDKKNEK